MDAASQSKRGGRDKECAIMVEALAVADLKMSMDDSARISIVVPVQRRLPVRELEAPWRSRHVEAS
jgi:hypothetical protein